jgi:hypothetical protein
MLEQTGQYYSESTPGPTGNLRTPSLSGINFCKEVDNLGGNFGFLNPLRFLSEVKVIHAFCVGHRIWSYRQFKGRRDEHTPYLDSEDSCNLFWQ